MDISDFALSKDPRPLTVIHPTTGEQTDMILHIISPDSPEFRKLTVEIARQNVGPKNTVDIEKFAKRAEEISAAVITGWEGIKMGGKPFAYNKKNAVKLIVEFPWIAEQVERFIKNRENFFAKSAKE